ncbi:hypothetical protein EVAR_67324_1 [Eumeta japonica]|uniref:Uncharacterized protein n=1 Tax=Eumeta variegata TaxID=151549 RepID=A0A4C1Z864_EUMVA|nr:hypothetical protein EVAR_67324_1 [Eumeta japonica]
MDRLRTVILKRRDVGWETEKPVVSIPPPARRPVARVQPAKSFLASIMDLSDIAVWLRLQRRLAEFSTRITTPGRRHRWGAIKMCSHKHSYGASARRRPPPRRGRAPNKLGSGPGRISRNERDPYCVGDPSAVAARPLGDKLMTMHLLQLIAKQKT